MVIKFFIWSFHGDNLRKKLGLFTDVKNLLRLINMTQKIKYKIFIHKP